MAANLLARVPRTQWLVGAVVVLLGLLTRDGGPAAAAAATPTSVTPGFDDGTADQFDNGFPILSAHGMHATFFVNTGPILAADLTHMTWSELHALANTGNEISGHTIDHADLKPLSVADAEHQVCDDRNTLLAQGFS